MRYGVLFSCQDPPGSPIGHPAVYEAALEQVVAAEAQGYEWVNITDPSTQVSALTGLRACNGLSWCWLRRRVGRCSRWRRL